MESFCLYNKYLFIQHNQRLEDNETYILLTLSTTK